jgi:polyisoprenyl-teichoic acid--peptidoglycan teichoic acid transferase
VPCLALLAACSGQGGDGSSTGAAPTSAETTTGTADAALGTRPADVEEQTATSQSPQATEEPTEEPTEDESQGAPLPEGTVTALLIGTDSRDGDLGGLSDVIVLVQLSEDREHLTLVSVARDSYVDIPGHGRDKVNAAFARGGIPLLRETVSELMGGLEIDLVAQTNFEMFIALTRWMDGFEVDNEHETTVTVESTGRELVFEEGPIWLENTDGLIYVRERKGLPLGDLDRTERHRAALVGMMERLVEIREEDPAKLLELLPMLYQNVKVEGNLQLEHLMTMVEVGAELGPDDVTSLVVPVSHFGSSPTGASVNILDEGRLRELGTGLRRGDLSGYVDRFGTSYALTGG